MVAGAAKGYVALFLLTHCCFFESGWSGVDQVRDCYRMRHAFGVPLDAVLLSDSARSTLLPPFLSLSAVFPPFVLLLSGVGLGWASVVL